VDNHGAVIEQNPVAVLIAFEAEPAVAELLLHYVVDGVAHRAKLAVARAGRNDKVVKRRRLIAHVENQHILPAVVFSLPRRCQG